MDLLKKQFDANGGLDSGNYFGGAFSDKYSPDLKPRDSPAPFYVCREGTFRVDGSTSPPGLLLPAINSAPTLGTPPEDSMSVIALQEAYDETDSVIEPISVQGSPEKRSMSIIGMKR